MQKRTKPHHFSLSYLIPLLLIPLATFCPAINQENNPPGGSTCMAICSDTFGVYRIFDNSDTSLGSIGENTPVGFDGSITIKNNGTGTTLIQQTFTHGNTVYYQSYGQYATLAGQTLELSVTITPSSLYPASTTTHQVTFTSSTICGSQCAVSDQIFNIKLP